MIVGEERRAEPAMGVAKPDLAIGLAARRGDRPARRACGASKRVDASCAGTGPQPTVCSEPSAGAPPGQLRVFGGEVAPAHVTGAHRRDKESAELSAVPGDRVIGKPGRLGSRPAATARARGPRSGRRVAQMPRAARSRSRRQLARHRQLERRHRGGEQAGYRTGKRDDRDRSGADEPGPGGGARRLRSAHRPSSRRMIMQAMRAPARCDAGSAAAAAKRVRRGNAGGCLSVSRA